MSRRTGFGAIARSAIRAAAQAERARQVAQRRYARELERSQKLAEREARSSEREATREYIASRMEEVAYLTADVSDREQAIQMLLQNALGTDPIFDLNNLYETYHYIAFDPAPAQANAPLLQEYLPKRPGILIRCFSKKYARSIADSQERFEAAQSTHLALMRDAESAHDEQQKDIEAQVNASNADVDALKAGLAEARHDAVVEYYKLSLNHGFTEEVDPTSADVGYAAESRHLVVDLEMPGFDVVPDETSFKYVKNADRIDPIARNAAKKRAMYANLIAQAALKCVDMVFRGGGQHAVDCLTLNGMLDARDPATGQDVRVCLLSLRITSDSFAKLNLSRVQPEECLKSLRLLCQKRRRNCCL